MAILEAEHRWVSGVLDDLASGELYWDRETIRAWADGLQDTMGAFPGIPRTQQAPETADPAQPATVGDLPP